MSSKVFKIRILQLVAVLACIATMSSDVLLAVHLENCSNEHEHRDTTCDSESSGNQTPEHDSGKCPICMILLGVSDNFICDCPTSITLTNDQAISTASAVLVYIDQYQFSPAIPRGPPLS